MLLSQFGKLCGVFLRESPIFSELPQQSTNPTLFCFDCGCQLGIRFIFRKLWRLLGPWCWLRVARHPNGANACL